MEYADYGGGIGGRQDRSCLTEGLPAARTGRVGAGLVAAAVAFAFTAPPTPPASASHVQAPTHHWRAVKGYPLKVTVIDSVSSGWRSQGVLRDARRSWNRGQGKVRLVAKTGASGRKVRKSCPVPDKIRKVRVCNFNFGPAGPPGYFKTGGTKWHEDGEGHFFSGSILINGYYFRNYSARRRALCNDLGHILGLEHRGGRPRSCMADPATFAYWPDAHDYQQVASNHDHRHVPPARNSAEADPGAGRVVIDWSAAPQAESYRVYRATAFPMQEPRPDRYAVIATTKGTRYTDTGAFMTGYRYCWFVKTVTKGATSAPSPTVCKTWAGAP